MMMIRSILILGLLVSASACAGFTPDPEEPSREPFTDVGPPTSITLLVDNRNFTDARLYVLRRGARTTLGVIGGKSQAEYEIDWDISDPIQIEIDLLAGPTCTTEELRADPGDVLELQIDQDFMHSSACR
jgi:hypothetical protein